MIENSISVIICAYTEKRWDDLLAVVGSLRHQTVQPREIIIVVDYNEALLKRIQEHIADVIAIENRRAKGASGSRNTGVAIAQGTVVAFLDDDVIAEPTWAEHLLAPYDDPTIVGVGGEIDPLWVAGRPAWFPDEFTWVVGCTFRGMPSDIAPNRIAANMSVRRDIFIAMGGFRESSGWNHKNRENRGKTKERFNFRRVRHYEGGEEPELCIRIARQYQGKMKFTYTPLAAVKHHVPEQRTRWRYFLWRSYYEGVGKAFLVSLHGMKDGLVAERNYTFKALPQAVLRELRDALFHHDLSGFARAGAIIVGLSATVAGYLMGSVSLQLAALRNVGTTATPRRQTPQMLPPIEVQQKVGEAD
jgi:glycosyltransferase involved in cell wall biosynthesis